MKRSFPIVAATVLTGALGVSPVDAADPLATERDLSFRPPAAVRPGLVEPPCTGLLPAHPLSAVDVLDLAICNNPQTREAWAAARVQAAQTGVARAAWLPTLNTKYAGNRVAQDNRYSLQQNAALTLSWLAFDFGGRQANIANAQQLMLAATASQQATVQALFLAALQAYYTAQATQAVVQSTREAERAAQASLAAAESRYRVGSATPADRLQARTALSQATLNRIRAEGEARNALGGLANVMGFSPRQNLVLLETPLLDPAPGFQRDVDELMQQATVVRPDLKAAEAQVKAAQAGITVARSQGLPTVTLSAGPTWQDMGGMTTQGGTLGLAVNIPLFSGFETGYRVRAAEAQVEVRSAQRDRLRQQVALDVWKAYQTLTTATQSLTSAADLVASAEQSERVALGRYQAGVGNVLDLLNAQAALASARLQRIQAALDWNIYRATLAQAVGALDYSLLERGMEGKP